MQSTNRPISSLILAAFIYLLAVFFYDESGLQHGNPRKPTPVPSTPHHAKASKPVVAQEGIPETKPEDIRIIDEGESRHSASGSTFLISAGHFLTARHVVSDCDAIGIEVEEDYLRAAYLKELLQPQDLALVRYLGFGKPIPLAATLPKPGAQATHFGFPNGILAAVHSQLIAQQRIRSLGRLALRENSLVWAEGTRFPNFDHALSGISGGPVLLRNGQVLGVNIAASPRRGRIITSDPEVFIRFAQQKGRAKVMLEPAFAINADNPFITAQKMAASGTLRRLFCRVEKAG